MEVPMGKEIMSLLGVRGALCARVKRVGVALQRLGL